jgi:thiaminase
MQTQQAAAACSLIHLTRCARQLELSLQSQRKHTRLSRADKALTRFLIRWSKQGMVLQLVSTGCAAAGCSRANWSMRKLENGGFTIKPVPGDRVIRDRLQTALVTRSSQRPTP